MTHVSLFSGIGGDSVAAKNAGFETVAFCEKDEFCQKVLAKNFPGVKIYKDVTQFNPKNEGIRGVTVTSGGFPCQPFSSIGYRTGASDERFLFHELLRCAKEMESKWILAENVAGLLTIDNGRTFGRILHDLDEGGYCAGWLVYGANLVGSPQLRKRVFILAYAKSKRRGQPFMDEVRGDYKSLFKPPSDWANLRNAFARGSKSLNEWADLRPDWFIRDFDGIPSGLDRFRALGNAIVPQQVQPIFEAIAMIERGIL